MSLKSHNSDILILLGHSLNVIFSYPIILLFILHAPLGIVFQNIAPLQILTNFNYCIIFVLYVLPVSYSFIIHVLTQNAVRLYRPINSIKKYGTRALIVHLFIYPYPLIYHLNNEEIINVLNFLLRVPGVVEISDIIYFGLVTTIIHRNAAIDLSFKYTFNTIFGHYRTFTILLLILITKNVLHGIFQPSIGGNDYLYFAVLNSSIFSFCSWLVQISIIKLFIEQEGNKSGSISETLTEKK